ncbi:MAG: hypothetical protein GY860_03545 [Desulfobacteraceae bacterium]|nr:hypothetical protein [Desulfobacteraceae bacterium]
MIGLNHKGNPVPIVLERAIQTGKATGLVSDTLVTHATPAAFAGVLHHTQLGQYAINAVLKK